MIGKDIVEAIKPVVDALEQLGVAYYIGGSVASSAMGKPRSTLDVDIVADLEIRHVGPLVARLENDYYIVDSMIEDAINRRSSFNIIYLRNAIKVDVFIPQKDAFASSELNRRQRISVGQGKDAKQFHMASPEDVILRKLDWFKMGGGVSERQWLDVLGVLKLNAHGLNFDYLRAWSEHLDVRQLLEQAMREAGLQVPEGGEN